MDHLIGQRFNLISKSEIRYLGTLHEINPEDSTIALEDVYSFGTEDRQAQSFIPPSQHKFDYIVFRGGDVKDIKIAEEQKENKQPSPQNVPNDPAILNASRPGPSQQGPPRDQSPFHPPGYGPPPHFGGYYPPQQFGRGFGPPPGNFGPGPGFQGPPQHYGPPPPGYFAPPGQGFPQGPNQFPPPPIGTPGQRHPQPSHQHQRPPSPGRGPPPQQTSELPVDNKAQSKTTTPVPQPDSNSAPPTEPTPSMPAATSATKAPPSYATTAATPLTSKPLTAPNTTAATVSVPSKPPTGPKSNRVVPAVPMTVNQKSFVPPIPASTSGPLSSTPGNTGKQIPTQAAMEAASRQAKDAVAAAMAKLKPQSVARTAQPQSTTTAVELLTRNMSEMKATEASPRGGRGGLRGRGNYNRSSSGGQQARKIDVPKSDYDFESANAKFNKEDMIKEAIASGSPIGETPEGTTNGEAETDTATNGVTRKDSTPVSGEKAYDKKSSFFDNISSEARDREEGTGRGGGRQIRGEEFSKNMETFGQGNVDGGFRGRGRGFGRGRGYGGGYRGFNRGYGGAGRGNFNPGFQGRGRGGSESAQAPVAS